jgi:hypothetical protein
MGTALTGLEIRDTYDALLKITDNGPLSGTAKYLSDGLGNDSALALSTAAAGIGTTTIVSGTKLTVGGPLAAVGSAGTMGTFETSASACFIGLKDASGSLVYLGGDDGNFLIQTPSSSYSTKLTLTDAGNVGIGTSAPAEKLDVYGNLNFSIPDAVSVSAKESLIVKMNSILSYLLRMRFGIFHSNSQAIAEAVTLKGYKVLQGSFVTSYGYDPYLSYSFKCL